MNSKIFNHLREKIEECFTLPKYHGIRENITADTVVLNLPWTPVRLRKFQESIEETFDLPVDLRGTVKEIAARIDTDYMSRFFGSVWRVNGVNQLAQTNSILRIA